METNTKKPYQKPQIQEVKLVPEEAVLAFCKTTSGRGTDTNSCASSRFCTGSTRRNGGS